MYFRQQRVLRSSQFSESFACLIPSSSYNPPTSSSSTPSDRTTTNITTTEVTSCCLLCIKNTRIKMYDYSVTKNVCVFHPHSLLMFQFSSFFIHNLLLKVFHDMITTRSFFPSLSFSNDTVRVLVMLLFTICTLTVRGGKKAKRQKKQCSMHMVLYEPYTYIPILQSGFSPMMVIMMVTRGKKCCYAVSHFFLCLVTVCFC